MANRKESLRKAYGITEYPWSSEDEENHNDNQGQDAPTTAPEEVEAIALDEARPSIATISMSPQAISQRSQTRLERDIFWSIVNNPRLLPWGPPRPTPANESASGDRVDLNCPVSNIQRIMAIRKLSANPNNYNRHRTSPYHPSSSSSRMHDNQLADDEPSRWLQRIDRLRRLVRRRSAVVSTGNQSFLETVHSSRQGEGPSAENPDDAHENANNVVDDEQLEQEISFSPHEEEDQAVENEDIDATSMLNNVSMEEEIVVIEPEGAPNGDAAANSVNIQHEENNEQSTSEASQQQKRNLKRKRDAVPDEVMETSSLKDMNQKLLRLLECPVCLEWMEPPLSQCGRGHLLCGRCRLRLSSCPVCRTAFSSVRNRAMEAVAELVRYPCRHGCGREKRLRRRIAHEASCPSRLYRCPAPFCADRNSLSLTELPIHIKTHHLSMLRTGPRQMLLVKVNSEQHDHWLVTWSQHLFHVRLDAELNRGVFVYVAYIGPMSDARKFTYEVTVQGQHSKRKLVYTRATHGDLECSALNVTRKDCFHLPLEHALNFLRDKYSANDTQRTLELVVEIAQRETRPPRAGDTDS